MKKNGFINSPITKAAIVMLAYMICVILFFFATQGALQFGSPKPVIEETRTDQVLGEITRDTFFEQYFTIPSDSISGISLSFATFGREIDDILLISIVDGKTGKILHSEKLSTKVLKDGSMRTIYFSKYVADIRGKELSLKIASERGIPGKAVAPYRAITTGSTVGELAVNSIKVDGTLSFTIYGRNLVPFTQYYFGLSSLLGILLLAYSIRSIIRIRRRKQVGIAILINYFKKYAFLLNQLVGRDFKTKYKRSVLGVLWSLLNPLLMMTVQYIVFSRLFRFEIQNYAVYLLSGIVLFSFMSEATSLSMMSILQNANLINKVFVPKFIYPFSRVLSSSVNFIFAFASLIIVILATGLSFSLNYFFLLYGLLCLILFIVGLSLILSTMMVFFHDTQFLYNIILQIWLYLTPLFYPEEILPDFVLQLEQFNPMYHFVKFARTIILQGVLPDAKSWLYCGIFAVASFLFGILIFNRKQNKFVLYI